MGRRGRKGGGDPGASVRRAVEAYTSRGGGGTGRKAYQLCGTASACESAGTQAQRGRRRIGGDGGAVPRANSGDGDRGPGDIESGWRICSAGSRLSDAAVELHAQGQRRHSASESKQFAEHRVGGRADDKGGYRCAGGAGGQSTATGAMDRSGAGERGVCDLHIRIHGPSQGSRGPAPQRGGTGQMGKAAVCVGRPEWSTVRNLCVF